MAVHRRWAAAVVVALTCLVATPAAPVGSATRLRDGGVAGVPIGRTGADASGASGTPQPSFGPTFHAIAPARLADSRVGLGLTGPIQPGVDPPITVAGSAGVGAAAAAVVLTVTVTQGTSPSFVTVYPADTTRPVASTVNFAAGQTVANGATVRLSVSGALRVHNELGAAHVVIDVVGWYDDGSAEPDSLFNRLEPRRVLDSRGPIGGWNHQLAAGDANVTTLTLDAGSGVPLLARSVVLNVTVTNGDAGSFVEVWPDGQSRPTASTVNFAPFQTVASSVTVALGPGGKVAFYNEVGATDVVVDLLGYYDPTHGATFHPMAPNRVLDDRVGVGAIGPWGPQTSRSVAVAGAAAGGVPVGATGIVGNVTVTNPSVGTWVALTPPSPTAPTTSTVNAGPNGTVANQAYTGLGSAGDLRVFNELGTVDVVLDVAGWFDGDARTRPVYYTGPGWPDSAFYQLGSATPIVTAPGASALPVPGDYDGDGQPELAFVTPAGDWITYGTAGTVSFPPPAPPGDDTYHPIVPVPAVYDATGRAKPAWYREFDATWFILGQSPLQFGQGPTSSDPPTSYMSIDSLDQDTAAPADFDGDGIVDLATYRARTARWMIRNSTDGAVRSFTLGNPLNLTYPVPADWDGVGHAQATAYDGLDAWHIEGHLTPDSFGAHDWGFPDRADYAGVGHPQLAYISYPYTGHPAVWHVAGDPVGGVMLSTVDALPLGFPAALWVDTARLTAISKCMIGWWTC